MVMIQFLSVSLRDEGGFDFKNSIVDTLLELIHRIPETLDSTLFHLCEYIEDSEWCTLSTQVLKVLGDLGPSASHPEKYIRFVYNRVILENAHVRAAAVSALGQFGVKVPSLAASVIILLTRCQHDDDDEVRDRATTLLHVLRNAEPEMMRKVVVDKLPVRADTIAKALEMYDPNSPGPLSFEALPHVEEKEITDHERLGLGNKDPFGAPVDDVVSGDQTIPSGGPNATASPAELMAMPEFAGLGKLVRSTIPEELTEKETEYLVRVVKHVFPNHLVLQFNLTNTLEDQVLSQVQVCVEEVDTEFWDVESKVLVQRLPYDVTKSMFLCLAKRELEEDFDIEEEGSDFVGEFTAELKFLVKDVDPDTGVEDEEDEGYEEDYPLNNIDVSVSDFMVKNVVADFSAAWEGE